MTHRRYKAPAFLGLAALALLGAQEPCCDPTQCPDNCTPGSDVDLDGFTCEVDCDDANPWQHPDAPEICDGYDNNCDGIVDNVDGNLDGNSDCEDNDRDGYSEAEGDCNDDPMDSEALLYNPGSLDGPGEDGVQRDYNCDQALSFLVDPDIDETVTIESTSMGRMNFFFPAGSIPQDDPEIARLLKTTDKGSKSLEIDVKLSPINDDSLKTARFAEDRQAAGAFIEFRPSMVFQDFVEIEYVFDPWVFQGDLAVDPSFIRVSEVRESDGAWRRDLSALTHQVREGRILARHSSFSSYVVNYSRYLVTYNPCYAQDDGPGSPCISPDETSTPYFEVAHGERVRAQWDYYWGKYAPLSDGARVAARQERRPGPAGGHASTLERDTPLDGARVEAIASEEQQPSAIIYPPATLYLAQPEELQIGGRPSEDGIYITYTPSRPEGDETPYWLTGLEAYNTTGAPRTLELVSYMPVDDLNAWCEERDDDPTTVACELMEAPRCSATFSLEAVSTLVERNTDMKGRFYVYECVTLLIQPDPETVDEDGDGFFVEQGGQPSDCDDHDPSIHPSATERCDGVDNDCDGAIDELNPSVVYFYDFDGDGFGDDDNTEEKTSCEGVGVVWVSQGGDCDDHSATVNPGATEVCNGVSDDCDAQVDEGATQAFYSDQDQDGFGDPQTIIQACSTSGGLVSNGDDCDDTDRGINPDADDILCDGADDDCDGLVDEENANNLSVNGECQCGSQSPFYGSCIDGQIVCDYTSHRTTYYRDADGDGYGVAADAIQQCDPDDGYVPLAGDCDDGEASAFPGGTERCDEIDNDCDGSVDEGVTGTFYLDSDGDGFGLEGQSSQACALPAGYAGQSGDVNDSNPLVYPGAPELCDGLDNDGDGAVDENSEMVTFYRDLDGDGLGNVSAPITDCEQPQGYVANASDCDDTSASIGLGQTYYVDGDRDGYGRDGAVTLCALQSGYAANAGDCNDLDSSMYPGAPETCGDAIDSDCDGTLNDQNAQGATTFYWDNDGDGFGTTSSSKLCDATSGYQAIRSDDCDDSRSNVYPGATEICGDGRDNDCDGTIDDGCQCDYTVTLKEICVVEAQGGWSETGDYDALDLTWRAAGYVSRTYTVKANPLPSTTTYNFPTEPYTSSGSKQGGEYSNMAESSCRTLNTQITSGRVSAGTKLYVRVYSEAYDQDELSPPDGGYDNWYPNFTCGSSGGSLSKTETFSLNDYNCSDSDTCGRVSMRYTISW